LVGIKPFSRAD